MAKIISIILLVIGGIFLLVQLVRHWMTSKRIITAFRTGNVITCGSKGFGKDVLTSYVIYKRAETYFANYDYGYDYHHIDIKDLLLGRNEYNAFIQGNVELCSKNDVLEGHDIYISDGGIYLPSQMDYLLHKTYPSLPITYALNRHLFNNGLHVNCQRVDRLWKALREQADYFVLLRKKCLKLPFFIVLFTTEYDRYESARMMLQPMKGFLFNKYSKAEKAQYQALHGFVKNGLVIVPKRILKYDSRAFHKIIFGYSIEKEEGLCRKIWKKLKGISKNKDNK